MNRFTDWVQLKIKKLEPHTHSVWYPFAVSFIAILDNFIFVIPIAGVLISSVLLAQKRWLSIAFWLTLGSTLGATGFAAIVIHFGISLFDRMAPQMTQSSLWITSEQWLHDYGLGGLFMSSLLPITDHPMIAVASLAHLPLSKIFLCILGGKSIKYFLIAWLASHAPHKLNKLSLK